MKSYCLLFACALWVSMASGEKKTYSEAEYTVKGHDKVVVCYWGTWANYRPKEGKFTPEDVDPSLCTHLIYSFAGLDSDNNVIKPLDPWMDLEEGYGLQGYRKATDLKYAYPHLKVTIAIGGWNEGSKKYSEMVADADKRKNFTESVVAFCKEHNFDGLDLDWEYPGKRGGSPDDKANFIKLVRDLKKAFRPLGLLLTAAIGAAAPTIDVAYDIPQMYKYLDYVHVMCYDYHGKWDRKTGHNAPLYSRPNEKGQDLFLNVDYTLEYLMKKGALAEKTVLGVPLYGRAFTLMNPHDHKMGARAQTTSFQGPYTREDGFLGYNEICEMLTDTDDTESWTVHWEDSHKAPYMNKGLQWISYDNEESIRTKTGFAFKHNLAGVMVWSIDTDDFRGNCGGATYPLLRSINNALYEQEQGIASAPKPIGSTLTLATALALVLRQLL